MILELTLQNFWSLQTQQRWARWEIETQKFVKSHWPFGSINYQNLSRCAINKKIHQEHPQIGKSYKKIMQNLRYHCRQRIEALVDKCANKTSQDSLSNFKLLNLRNFMSNNHYQYFSTTWRKCLNSVNLWNCEGCFYTNNFLQLCAILHIVQSLLIHNKANHSQLFANSHLLAS